ncbi:MOSC domain-containing protein [Roseivivax isoporae]|uniref:Molybdenum cofactor biosysynthesis protein n=1 Tax=Roseivivax isoporae LMG 25204 TaxID=1449351 RepID=X7FCP4_9RHOB|nr:MOSC N-terminal beta barrel domain-containing protein [Roseivivax isoporae]ETX30565.1 molybdenum cofactor biosysynthesis protein [Roseivivax isoporae LMG 25204]
MSARVTGLWRFPIKAHGREAVEAVDLTAGRTMPWDRVWAVAHQRSDADGSEWLPCRNFTRGANVPALMAISVRLDEAAETVTLSHPDRPDITLSPDRDGAAFLDWVRPLHGDSTWQPARIVRAQARGMTDSDFASLTLCNMSSHRAVEQRIGRPLSIHRWRGNVWLDGLAPWEEFDWIGREVQVGGAVFKVRERTGRCRATEANPDTGQRDTDMLATLGSWGHTDFSVMAEVVRGGRVTTGDTVRLL